MWEFTLTKFSLLITLWLQMHNLAPVELAELAGISSQKVHQFMREENAPTMAELTAICNAVDFSPETFFRKVKK